MDRTLRAQVLERALAPFQRIESVFREILGPYLPDLLKVSRTLVA